MEKPKSDGVVPPTLGRSEELAKTLTGIRGLDEILRGGLPTGRPTLVCGGPGSGKTLLAMTFLVNGALQFDEPGVAPPAAAANAACAFSSRSRRSSSSGTCAPSASTSNRGWPPDC